jgi:hypothetical protein
MTGHRRVPIPAPTTAPSPSPTANPRTGLSKTASPSVMPTAAPTRQQIHNGLFTGPPCAVPNNLQCSTSCSAQHLQQDIQCQVTGINCGAFYRSHTGIPSSGNRYRLRMPASHALTILDSIRRSTADFHATSNFHASLSSRALVHRRPFHPRILHAAIPRSRRQGRSSCPAPPAFRSHNTRAWPGPGAE